MKQTLKTAYVISLILLLTACGVVTPAPTVMPTATAMSTFTPTLTAVPTNTPTAISTLSVEQARAELLDLLATNGDCRLPCLWGITPGKSTYQEAQAVMVPLSNISVSTSFKSDSGVIRPVYTEGDSRLGIDVGFLSDNQIVNYITFHAGESKELPDASRPIYDSKIFGERLRPYMLPGILSELGKPASVVISTSGKQITGSGGFEILLLYPDQGILVRYTTQMETVGAIVHGCPANAQVKLELYPSGDADAFAKSLAETTLGGIFDGLELVDNPSWKSVEKATSMSLEQFYETFRQPTDKCIETPLKGWYVPEYK